MDTSTLVVIYDTDYNKVYNKVLVHHNPTPEMVERIESIQGTYINIDDLTEEQVATHLYLQGYTEDGKRDDSAENDGWIHLEDTVSLTLFQAPVRVVLAGCAY